MVSCKAMSLPDPFLTTAIHHISVYSSPFHIQTMLKNAEKICRKCLAENSTCEKSNIFGLINSCLEKGKVK